MSRASIILDFDVAGVSYRGHTVASLQAAGVAPDVILDAVKNHLRAGVDARAEALRLTVVTPGEGQAMEYQEAQSQAFAVLASATATAKATPEKYPMLAASIGLDLDPDTGAPATDVAGVARAVVKAYGGWLQAGAAIRAARLTAKAAISTAGTIEAALAAYDAAVWPAL